MRDGSAAAGQRRVPHHGLHLPAPAQRAPGHPAGPGELRGVPALGPVRCSLVSHLPVSREDQSRCPARLCHRFWHLFRHLLFWLVLGTSLCAGVDVLWNHGHRKRIQYPQVRPWYSFCVAIGYLTLCHVSRIYIFHYGILTTDFSGPLMIVTQKITTLAFQVHDGLGRREEDLSAEQHRLAVKVKPSFLEYLSYLLNFMSVIAGPCNNFKDYLAFIEGRQTHMKLLEVNWKQKGLHSLPAPSPTGAVIYKLGLTLVSLLLFLTLTKTFPVTCLADDWFVHKANFLTRLFYLYVVMQASKPKYYFAWTLADAVNNAAGFGFSGVDKNGNFCWDLLSNLNIWKIETATSFKMYLENWNIQTATWLKRVCYERVPRYPTVLTFVLSALWHGVYPGYYFTFLTGMLITVAARTVRNHCRHYFLSSKALKAAYDVATWAATQLAVSYTVAPFVMLAVEPTISLYKSMYFYLHIISLLIVLFLPVKPQAPRQRRPRTLNSVNKEKAD
ncbi:Lysophospholipid Acyltransferase 1 [Manis pentadactyla]|nr:Lysophospholipid Acyltransferase 1 [Manis pentadactyla]